mmetsp:Transcript_64340/g.121856  ORF Transcript_64340/g.121856 Transcript_64340/m.121856 type:complete len:257 (-) Transcript_64340:107-877(-)
MGVIAPAPGVLGGCSLLTAVELICFVHLIVCIVIVSLASSVTPVDFAGVTISPFLQCVNAGWFLLGIPCIVIGGIGAVFRVENQLKVYLAYLAVTLLVVIAWLLVFVRYGNACNTIQPVAGSYKKQALMVCQASNGMVLFWMLVLVAIVAGSIYLVWSMKEYVHQRLITELLRYQEPWESVVMLADDAAEQEAAERRATNTGWEKLAAWAPQPYFTNPYKPTMPPNWAAGQGAQAGYGGTQPAYGGTAPAQAPFAM